MSHTAWDDRSLIWNNGIGRDRTTTFVVILVRRRRMAFGSASIHARSPRQRTSDTNRPPFRW